MSKQDIIFSIVYLGLGIAAIILLLCYPVNAEDCGWYNGEPEFQYYNQKKLERECHGDYGVILNQIAYWCSDNGINFYRDDPRTIMCDCYVNGAEGEQDLCLNLKHTNITPILYLLLN